MSKEEYFKLLNHHDCYYHYSDDHGVWSNVNSIMGRIQTIAMNDSELDKIN